MGIVIRLDEVMAKKKVSLNELSDRVGITLSNLSILKNQKAKAIRLSTLAAICRALDCQPGDIIAYKEDDFSENKD
ncbi:putative transcriptional regulator [Sphingobacterium nematocida]|uniref:Putative transcriptional regulator n=1 Tax=Sphingobacterium nematocida TaxID=1513896 RepID=A0A1T5CNX1_9SPHI|nr:helix-turn-helix transcriptional regulator [Sphingobacterium nematocida]SKB61137.1 putative transcriptional regulator [Sphingobacterium nematocida]